MALDAFRQWSRRSLANTFALRAAVTALISVLVVAGVSVSILLWTEHQAIKIALHHDAQTAVARVEDPLRVVARTLDELARSPMFATALLDSGGRAAYARPFLQNYHFPFAAANGLALCDLNGQLLAGSATLGECGADRPEFAQVLADGKPRQAWQVSNGRQQWLFFQGINFAYTGTTEGLLVARVDLDELLRPLPGELNLASVTLQPVAGPGDVSAPANAQWIALFKGAAVVDAGPLALLVVGQPRSVWTKLLPLLGGYFLATLTLLVVIVLRARRDSRALIEPLAALRDRAQEIAEAKDLSLPIPKAGTDEVGQLADSLAIMVASLRTAEDQRRLSEARFRLIFDKSDEAILFAWPDGRIEAANPAACRLFGHSEAEFSALGRAGVMDTTDPGLPAALEERHRTGTFRGELRCRHADGRVFPVEIVSTLFLDALGTARTSNLFRDISERKRQEEALQQSEARFRSYFELGLIGMAITSPDKGWVVVNDELCRILGYSRDELVTRTWAELTHPGDLAVDLVQFERTLNKEINGGVIDKRFITKNGQIVWATMSIKCLRKPDGSIDYFVAMVQDISERVAAERERAESSRRLATLSHNLVAVQEATRRRLAQELHDRTSPNLAAIAINLESAALFLHQSDWQRVAERMADNRALIEDTAIGIREICTDLRPPALDYAGLVAAVDAYVSQFSRRTGIAVAVECAPEAFHPPAEVESMLFRIVQEALTNVAKHAQATRASVSLAVDKAEIVLTIRDDGHGFTPDQPAGHAGLGLINMREMAEFLGGTFDIQSSPDCGTRVHVTIQV
jgi:PAS domain S-box-containing protein